MAKKSSPEDLPVQGLRIENRSGWLWVTLPDAINMDNHLRIESRVEALMTPQCRIAIDLGGTKNFYSSGFGMIVRLKKMIEERGGTVYLINASERTMEALQGVGLTKLMRVFPEGAKLDFVNE